MQKLSFEEAVEQIVAANPRYQPDAYAFLREALEFTHSRISRPRKQPDRHVTVPELVTGIRDYALKTYGPMVLTVFEEWGIKECADFGNILFDLVEANHFSVTEQDKREQFDGALDFHEAFRKPFLPASAQQASPTKPDQG